MNHQLNDTILKNKVTPLKSYAEWTFHDITNSTFYIKNNSNNMVLTITTEDDYKYKVENRTFTKVNPEEHLWEKRFQENEKYFVLHNPFSGKVLSAHEDMLKIKGMTYTHIL